jgi:hypothetical protein
VLDVEGSFVHFQSASRLVNPPQSSVNHGLTFFSAAVGPHSNGSQALLQTRRLRFLH